MNRKKGWRIVSVYLVTAIMVMYTNNILNSPTHAELLVTARTQELLADRIVYFEQFEEEDFTCTGMTYDEKERAYWIADYGALNSSEKQRPRLLAIDNQFSRVEQVIELKDVFTDTPNIQGIAYDSTENIIWLAVGKEIVAFDKTGNKVASIKMKKHAYRGTNGIAYDNTTDTLWVLCRSKYLLNISKNGRVLTEVRVNLKDQDMLCFNGGNLYATVGADYYGDDNFVVSIDKNTGSVEVLYRLLDSYAVEGICFVNGKMYICNDGLYHNSIIQKSYVAEYSLVN